MYRVGYCITAHGFGHAARSVAVMEALAERVQVDFKVVTTVPEWFFRSSFAGSFSIFPIQNDVGLVQASALEIDMLATIRKLNEFYPLSHERIQECAEVFADCDLVITDIAPLGIAAARKAGVRSLLLENFTWDWIYEQYRETNSEFDRIIEYISEIYSLPDYHIQAAPVCLKTSCDLVAEPIARKIRNSKNTIRRKLNIANDKKLVLVSMGGEGIRQLPLQEMEKCHDIVYCVPGMKGEIPEINNVRFLPADSPFYHPDLVAAADVVIGKVGYSTLAEVYHAGVPFGYIQRPGFRESAPLVHFINKEMQGVEILAQDFAKGDWVSMLPGMFTIMPHGKTGYSNGADQCAGFIVSLL